MRTVVRPLLVGNYTNKRMEVLELSPLPIDPLQLIIDGEALMLS